MKAVLPILSTLFILSSCTHRNPVITSIYTADPSAHVFNDTLFLFPSHDRDSAVWWDMVDWHVLSTTDMKHWTDHGVALTLAKLGWAKRYAWAPDCNFKNGKYYFYYPTDQDYIGVAIGDHPAGPFKDPLGRPLIKRNTPGVKATRDLIDPCIFVDDDGQAYLFFGQNDVNVVVLNEDMVSFRDSAIIVQGTDHFFEAVWVHKREGIYYISYSGMGKILYGMSDNPLGPYTYRGEILDTVNSGTNHHSIVEFKGAWYFFYHNADLAMKSIKDPSEKEQYAQFRRSVCVEYLYYNEDGTIQKVNETKKGVKLLLF